MLRDFGFNAKIMLDVLLLGYILQIKHISLPLRTVVWKIVDFQAIQFVARSRVLVVNSLVRFSVGVVGFKCLLNSFSQLRLVNVWRSFLFWWLFVPDLLTLQPFRGVRIHWEHQTLFFNVVSHIQQVLLSIWVARISVDFGVGLFWHWFVKEVGAIVDILIRGLCAAGVINMRQRGLLTCLHRLLYYVLYSGQGLF